MAHYMCIACQVCDCAAQGHRRVPDARKPGGVHHGPDHRLPVLLRGEARSSEASRTAEPGVWRLRFCSLVQKVTFRQIFKIKLAYPQPNSPNESSKNRFRNWPALSNGSNSFFLYLSQRTANSKRTDLVIQPKIACTFAGISDRCSVPFGLWSDLLNECCDQSSILHEEIFVQVEPPFFEFLIPSNMYCEQREQVI